MVEEVVKGILYCQFHEADGPSIVSVMPSDMEMELSNLVSLRSITLLSGETGVIPKFPVIVPFPSVKMKGIIKYMQVKDESCRGGLRLTMVTLLFDDDYDAVFYKYMDYFNNIFNKTAEVITKIEESEEDKSQIDEELKRLRQSTEDLLIKLFGEEEDSMKAHEFPKKKEDDDDAKKYTYKVLVCGDPEVGKTSSVLRFTDSAFKRTYLPTIGVNVSEKKINLEESNLQIQFAIWDVAGQSKFQPMRKHFYAGAKGVMLMFDLTKQESFQNVKKWYQDINSNLKKKFLGLLIGNKDDLIDERKVSAEDIKILADELNLEYIQTSALSGHNVNEAFQEMGEKLAGLKKRKAYFIL